MKRITLVIFSSLLFSIGLNGCQQQISEDNLEKKQQKINVKEKQSTKIKEIDVRESVWNQLTEREKEHIRGTWEDASVNKIILRETMGNIKDKKLIGKEVFIVDYPSNDNPTLGGVTVYADIKSHRLIGFGYRE